MAKIGRVESTALYRIVGPISESHTIAEIGPEGGVAIGDRATVFDWTPGSRPEDLAAESGGASVYDLTMHLNPLLPGRVIEE